MIKMDEWENELLDYMEKDMEERWLFAMALLSRARIKLVWMEDELIKYE